MQNRSTPSTPPNKLIPLIALCLGYFMVIIDVTIVNIALPSLGKDLHGGVADLQWVVDGYTLSFACLLLSAGYLADRLGAKKSFLAGLIFFVLTSLGCSLAINFGLLIFFRILQGIAAALLVPTSLALINVAYPNKVERAKAIGLWASIGGMAAAAGPLLGAILTTWFSWRAVFLVNIPVGISAILLTINYVPNPGNLAKNSFDFLGQIVGIISIASLAFSLIEAGRLGWLSPIIIGSSIIFLAAFISFLIIEQRTPSPMLPLALFKSKNFSAAVVIGMLLNSGFYGELFVLPLYFQQLREYSVLITGLAILPQTAFIAIASFLAGRITSKFGPKWPIIIGLIMGASGFLALLITQATTPSYWILILPLVAIGFGAALAVPATTIAVINAAPNQCAGIASGAFNASRQLGSLMGVALFGTILNGSARFITGMHITLSLGAIAFLFGSVLAWLFVLRHI